MLFYCVLTYLTDHGHVLFSCKEVLENIKRRDNGNSIFSSALDYVPGISYGISQK